MSDQRQNPPKLMVGDPQHHRNLQHLLPLEELLCSVRQKLTIHHCSQVDFHLDMTHKTNFERTLLLPPCGGLSQIAN